MPDFVEPALATLKPSPPTGPEWLHEVKFDGYRLQARLEGTEVRLLTRSGLDWTDRFGPDIPDALRALPAQQALIDGELVVRSGAGASDFSALQADLSAGRNDRFVFYVFDLLYLDGQDLRDVPLIERKGILEDLVGPEPGRVRFSAHFGETGSMVLRHACRLSLEGIISKEADAPYRSGRGKAGSSPNARPGRNSWWRAFCPRPPRTSWWGRWPWVSTRTASWIMWAASAPAFQPPWPRICAADWRKCASTRAPLSAS
ncbi:hypothetical protein ACFSYD_21015 [Paracoccus aerius]